MLPDPLHPAVVHFPIVFMILLPLVAAAAVWGIARGRAVRLTWAAPVALAVALAVSSWVAVETGEQQEERVEDTVGEPALEAHEESATLFLWLSGALVVLTAAGLLSGRLGGAARVAATVGAVGLAVAGARVGHTGGKLVYQYGAASAYVQPGTGGGREGGENEAAGEREQTREAQLGAEGPATEGRAGDDD